jgi:hypothetical protein
MHEFLNHFIELYVLGATAAFGFDRTKGLQASSRPRNGSDTSARKEFKMEYIAIKNNIVGGDQPCALCGDLIHTHFGPDLFLEGSMQIVCRDCGHDHAPGLVDLLQLADKALAYSRNASNWFVSARLPCIPS